MYLVLLIFGGLLTVAGIALGASGVSIRDHAFDTTIITPGIVAAVGGLVLIGLGLALRVLQRIEHAVALRSAPGSVRPGELVVPAAAAERPVPAARIPYPQRILPHSLPGFAPAAPSREGVNEDLSEKASPIAPLERIPAIEVAPPPSAEPPPPIAKSVDEAVAEVDKTRGVRLRNGAAPARITPRLDLNARAPISSGRPNGPAFDSLWPKGPRPARAAQPASAQAVAAVEPEQIAEPPGVATAEPVAPVAAPEPVSVLKSGVVDGMAYTLYSDGSIEAELPQGMLRFGSITELRNHIEQSA